MTKDYEDIVASYRKYGERKTEGLIREIRLKREEKNYAEKLVHFAVKKLIADKCRNKYSRLFLPQDIIQTLKWCKEDISLISLIAADTNLSIVDD